jgi:hypothetical protein
VNAGHGSVEQNELDPERGSRQPADQDIDGDDAA